jgi:glycine cleavage system H protein
MSEEIFGFKYVPGLYYNEHVWAKVEVDGNVRVGFDDIVAKGMVNIFAVMLSPIRTKVIQKKKLGVMESVKYTGPIVCPVSGEIIAVSERIRSMGYDGFKDDPYGEGWIVVIKPSNLEAELKNLMIGDTAKKWFTEEAEKLKDNLAAGEQGKLT